jgi:hypothetical protein
MVNNSPEAKRRVIIGKYTKNKPVNIIYREDPQRIIIKCVIILNSNKENSLTTMIPRYNWNIVKHHTPKL